MVEQELVEFLQVINLVDFLFKCLYYAKMSNQYTSTHINDGLKLDKIYITNILKCVPPGDKPLNSELKNCSNFLSNEINHLKNLKVIITLGKIAFDNCIKFYKKNYQIDEKILFKHGKKISLIGNITLIALLSSKSKKCKYKNY